jgi:predicted DNA-binding transcriptional regulator AlpA
MAKSTAPVCVLLSVADLADLLTTSSRTIHRLNKAALIPAPIRIGCRPRWLREEIHAWLNNGCPCRDAWQQIRIADSGGPDATQPRCLPMSGASTVPGSDPLQACPKASNATTEGGGR